MRCKAYIVIIFFCLGLLCPRLEAQHQQISFFSVKDKEGKSLRKINAITQDPHGYMWFCGTGAHSVYRYDGKRILKFIHNESDSNSLGFSDLETIYADSMGMIWIGGAALDQYNPSTGVFTHYKHNDQDSGSLSLGSVQSILRDHQGRLWVGTNKGLDRLDEKSGKFVHYLYDSTNPRSLSNDIVNIVYEDHQGVIWVGTGWLWFNFVPNRGGLNRLDPDGGFTRYQHDPANPQSLLNNKVRSIYEDSRGIFWVGTTGDGLHTMDREKGLFERHPHNPSQPEQLSRPPLQPEDVNDPISFIIEDGSGAIWIATRSSGINRYDTSTKKITHYGTGKGFPDSGGWKAFTSRDGVLWFGSEEGNLFRVDPSLITVDSVYISKETHATAFLEEKDGSLWVGTDGSGLFHYDQQKKLVHQYIHEESNPLSLWDNGLSTIYQGNADSLWVGTFSKGINIFNQAKGQFSKPIFKNANRLGSQRDEEAFIPVTGIIEDSRGDKWFGTMGSGLRRVNARDNSITEFHHDRKDARTLSTDRITSILMDNSGEIWAGGQGWQDVNTGGINRFIRQTGTFKHYLFGTHIAGMFKDSEGNIWTWENGGRIYRKTTGIDSFTLFYVLPPDLGQELIQGVMMDDKRKLWIAAGDAILELNTLNKETHIYGNRFGIEPGSMTGPIYKTGTGELLVGNRDGFYSFFPEKMSSKPYSAKIILADLLINNIPALSGKFGPLRSPVEEISELVLTHDQNNFTFHFAAIDYRDPEATRYYTRLENYDNEWREAGAENSANYFYVRPGHYLFHVLAKNSNGETYEKSIVIHVLPPWWLTWWAYSIYTILIAVIGFAIYRAQKQRIIRVERERTHARELAQAKEIEKAYQELKTTQAQLIQSEKMASLGELTAGIAHEIQNPLNFVNNFSELNTELIDEARQAMQEERKNDALDLLSGLRENEEKIKYHGQRADAIVKGMLQHSRIGSGQKEPTDINALADEYLRLAYHGQRAKNKSFNAILKTDFDPAIGKVVLVPQDIGRVLLNLYNNAFYALNEKLKQASRGFEPIVSVSTKKVGNMLELRVNDNGNGIPQKILDKIFQPFFTTKPTGQGTGLGLSLSYDIIKAHGGELKVKSREGEGAELIVELPLS